MSTAKKKFILIDDEPIFNFIHEKIVGLSWCADEIRAFVTCEDALDYLAAQSNDTESEYIILLDINMPVTNGFEFLRRYETLPREGKNKIYIYMLTSSLNPQDKIESKKFATVTGFFTKPLSQADVSRLCESAV